MPASAQRLDVSARIDERIASLGGWRAGALATLRAVIRAASPGIVEAWKWGNPVWACGGILCAGEADKSTVKMTFPKGASLPGPAGLFNASLDGHVRRAIDVRKGDTINEVALRVWIQAAVAANVAARKEKRQPQGARAGGV